MASGAWDECEKWRGAVRQKAIRREIGGGKRDGGGRSFASKKIRSWESLGKKWEKKVEVHISPRKV